MAAGAEVEEVEVAADGDGGPGWVAEVSCVYVEFAEGGEGEEGGEVECGAEGGVVWDVCVSEDEGDGGGETLVWVNVEGGAGDGVEGELLEMGYCGSDGYDKAFAAVGGGEVSRVE